ncbi:AsmA-like C-terminal region-containing protein [Lewinella cohaerens]|uniref:AsmA family protein n=1 Tax=Lewinella cohaerens TaxID=70995 RepID=UPI00036BCCC0|nr:AsmA-like C-terminal region-containing protein [Lewinella cohaerens]
MKRFFKRLLIVLSILFLLLCGAVFVISSLFSDQIGERVVSELNQQLKSELEVEGFELSFLRTFPNIGANLRGVSLKGTDEEDLLVADELSFRAGLWSLLGSDVQLKSVVLSDGILRIAVDRDGNANYDIFKTEETEPAPEENTTSASINLEKAVVSNMKLFYSDAQNKQRLTMDIEEAIFAGNFGSSQYKLNSEAQLFIKYLESDGESLLSNRPFAYNTEIAVNTEEGQYQIDELRLQVGELPLEASGNFRIQEEETFINLSFSSEDGKLEDVLSLLPDEYKNQLNGIETDGDFSLNATIEGVQNKQQQPKITAELRFADGRISGDRVNARVRDLGFLAYYTNGTQQNDKTSKIVIENLHGEFEREPFALDLTIENFSEPSIVFAADGTLAPGALMAFIPDERISSGNGKIHLNRLRIRGRYEDMLRSSRIGRVDMGGSLSFENAGFTINDEDISLSSGEIVLEQNTLTAKAVTLDAPGTKMLFDGRATNILPVLLADSVNSQGATLVFDARLQATELDIDQLMALGAPSEIAQEEAEATGTTDSLAQAEVEKREFFTRFLDGTFAAEIQSFNYDLVEGEDFKGNLTFKDGTMTIAGNTKTMDGEFLLDGEMRFTETPVLTAKLSGNRINIYEFFRQSENFGQDFLVADNLEGQLDTRIFVEAHFDNAGNFQEDQLRVLAGVGLKDGVLKDFAMLEDFSTFVNIRDLQEIRFTSLQNFFEVRNSKLYLPVMFIQSNALNMTISGEHTFDQDINYFVKVNAGQVMADRFRRHNAKLKPKPARRKGFFNLYYAILGNLDDYNFVSDKRRVENDFRESDRRKRDIHFELERLFGTIIELVDEPLDWRDIPEYEENPDSDEPEFLDMEIEGGN